MESLACLVVSGIIVWIVVAASKASSTGFDGLSKNGIPARGILLQVSWQATRVTGGSVPVERREVLVDVEIPGQAPYEVRVQALIPTNLSSDVMPGATVELRVHAKNRNAVAIVGPGSGFAVTGLVTAPPAQGALS